MSRFTTKYAGLTFHVEADPAARTLKAWRPSGNPADKFFGPYTLNDRGTWLNRHGEPAAPSGAQILDALWLTSVESSA